MMALYKKYFISEICFDFGPDGLHCVCNDYFNRIVVEFHVFAAKMTKYYCKEPISACFKHSDIATYFKKIIVESNYFSIFMNEADKRSKMYINLRDVKIGSDVNIPIDLRTKSKGADAPFDISTLDMEKYSVSFKLPSAALKTLVKTISGQINTCIQMKHGEFMQISRGHGNDGPNIKFDPSKIGLIDRLAENDILIANFETSAVKPFIEAQLSKEIVIHAHNFHPISLSSTDVDGRYMVRIFVMLKQQV
jgi:hypothetical protein